MTAKIWCQLFVSTLYIDTLFLHPSLLCFVMTSKNDCEFVFRRGEEDGGGTDGESTWVDGDGFLFLFSLCFILGFYRNNDIDFILCHCSMCLVWRHFILRQDSIIKILTIYTIPKSAIHSSSSINDSKRQKDNYQILLPYYILASVIGT